MEGGARDRAGWWRGGSACALALALLAGSGSCAEPLQTRVRLVVVADGDVRIPEQVDRVRVWVVASRTEDGELCAKVSRDFELRGPADLPILIDYYAGQQFFFWAAFRVEWYQGATMVAQREMIQPFPESGISQVEARLYGGCLTRGCLDSEQCVLSEGHLTCAGFAGAGAFSNPDLVVTTEPCDPTVVLDGGGDDGSAEDAGADDAAADADDG